MSDVESAAFGAVSANVVSGNAEIADMITPPNPNEAANGNGSWTIGFDQQDFSTNSATAQDTLQPLQA